MIRSLKANNGSFAQLGSPQVQPQIDDVSYEAKKQSTTGNSAVPAHQVQLPVSVMLVSGSTVQVTKQSSLSSIASKLGSPGFVLPTLSTLTNTVLPSFASQLQPVVAIKSSLPDNVTVPVKKFEPYEQLTGISRERPEIVMMTNFSPLFLSDVSHSHPFFIDRLETSGVYPFMTDAGRFVDTQVQVRNLRHVNLVHMVRTLSSHYPNVRSQVAEKKTALQAALGSLRTSLGFLSDVVGGVDRLKLQLDLRSDVHSSDVFSVVQKYLHSSTRSVTNDSFNTLSYYAARFVPARCSPVDSLIRLGYSSQNVRDVFSSTKIWLQLLTEMKELLRAHSLEFIDVDPTIQRSDKNPSSLVKATNKRFEFQKKLPTLPNLNELANVQASAAFQAVNVISQAYSSLYEPVHFRSDEAKIAGLVDLVSREFRYSAGLADAGVREILLTRYGYQVLPGSDNSTVFDSIMGKTPRSIAVIPSNQAVSLSGLAQQQVSDNVAVLTYETKYVEADTGTLTPGATYFIDHALTASDQSFDTSRIDLLAQQLEGSFKSFTSIVDGLNLVSNRVYDSSDKAASEFSTVLSDAFSQAEYILERFIDVDSGEPLFFLTFDTLPAVLARASSDNRIKSALFLLFVARAARAYQNNVPFLSANTQSDNTPLTDALVDSLVKSLQETVPTTKSGNQIASHSSQEKSSEIMIDSIRSAFKSGTLLLTVIDSLMGAALTAFRASALDNNQTRFSGVSDVALMMAFFDVLVYTVSRYCNQKIVSLNTAQSSKGSQGLSSVVISKIQANHKDSVSSLLGRLERETALRQQLIYSVLGSLWNLSNSLKSHSNFLNSPEAALKLREIVLLQDSVLHLPMLVNSQQVSLLSSTAQDFYDKALQGTISQSGDVDADGDFDADDEIRALDDAVPFPKLRDALYGAFGTHEFATIEGNNKKILTVGLPQGFAKQLQQRVSLNSLKRSSFETKQSDIINVVVYKSDLRNSDIIYKPKKFSFELSRFPVRNDNHILPVPSRPSWDDVMSTLPTRNVDLGTIRSSVEYWAGSRNALPVSHKAAMSDETYSFLSAKEKHNIIKNHVMSYLLEVYVKLLTGVSLGDYHFDMIPQPQPADADLIKTIVEHRADHVVTALGSNASAASQTSGGVLFSASAAKKTASGASSASQTVSGWVGDQTLQQRLRPSPSPSAAKQLEQQKPPPVGSNLTELSHRDVPSAVHDMRTISAVAGCLTTISNSLLVSKRLLQPKQFDRVFNIVVDSDEFEVDYDKTVSTPHGKQALEQMIKLGEIVPVDENDSSLRGSLVSGARPFIQSRAAPNVNSYHHRNRDVNEGDLVFEKYFVTIETYPGAGV